LPNFIRYYSVFLPTVGSHNPSRIVLFLSTKLNGTISKHSGRFFVILDPRVGYMSRML
jgi:hypothetical protein